MPSPNATPTPITPPRVPLIDPRTGLIDRAWYMFFVSLINAATLVYNVNIGPSPESLIASYDEALRLVNQELQTLPPVTTLQAPDVLGDCCAPLASQLAEMQKQIEGLQSQPITDVGALIAAFSSLSTAPVTVTADVTLGVSNWYINNKAGSALTLTFPAASSWTGRYITIKNLQAQLVNSASSNIVPIDSTTAGTAILLAVIGNWATIVSDGTNWVIMQRASNNNLLLE